MQCTGEKSGQTAGWVPSPIPLSDPKAKIQHAENWFEFAKYALRLMGARAFARARGETRWPSAAVTAAAASDVAADAGDDNPAGRRGAAAL